MSMISCSRHRISLVYWNFRARCSWIVVSKAGRIMWSGGSKSKNPSFCRMMALDNLICEAILATSLCFANIIFCFANIIFRALWREVVVFEMLSLPSVNNSREVRVALCDADTELLDRVESIAVESIADMV